MTASLAPRRPIVRAPGCAVVSESLGESPIGTATPTTSWLLVEAPGPWSASVATEVLREAFPGDRLAAVAPAWARHGLRPLVVRRPGRAPTQGGPRTVLLVSSHPGRTWTERLVVDDLRELADLDLLRVARGEGGLGTPVAGPTFLVCTHGAKDMCCAIHGRPLAQALGAAYPDATWECSHLGGDRYAGNLAILPHGLLYGRVTPEQALSHAAAIGAGEVPLAQLRGRTAWTMWGQVADAEVRRRADLSGLDDVVVEATAPEDAGMRVDVRAAGSRWSVRIVRRTTAAAAASHCRSFGAATAYEVLDATRVG